MRILTILLAIFALNTAASAAVVRPTKTKAPKTELAPKPVIYKGQRPTADSKTWRVSVLFVVKDSHCTATVIHERAILTAAHCIEELAWRINPAKLVFQNESGFTFNKQFSAKQFKSHILRDEWSSSRLLDLAVIVFHEKIIPETGGYHTAPLLAQKYLQSYEQLASRSLFIAGMGDNEATIDPDPKKIDFSQYAKLRFTGVVYTGLDENGIHIETDGESRLCQGDSGGGLFLLHGNELVLVGAASGGIYPHSDGCSFMGLYAPITSYSGKWIQDILAAIK
jgi:hypothetical protein